MARIEPVNSLLTKDRLTALALTAILIAGAFGAWWQVKLADSEMRADLLRQALLSADALNSESFRGLPFYANDTSLPAFQRLCNTMAGFTRSLSSSWEPARGYISIYSMKMREGKILFGPESIPVDDNRASPPGTVYENPPEALVRVFSSGQPESVGPFQDEYGSFVSAFVPLKDPDTGTVSVVLGMDIMSDDWGWSVAARAVVPVSLYLSLLILLGAVAWIARSKGRVSSRPVLRRLLLPLSFTLLLLVGGFALLLMQAERSQLQELCRQRKNTVVRAFERILDDQGRTLQAVSRQLAGDQTLIQALKSRDRDSLLEVYEPIFRRLKVEHSVSHFYFFTPELTVLLRMHLPQTQGDQVERFTARQAERIKGPASGIELGRFGGFTLRAVRPVFAGEELAGYIELGKEIDDVLDFLHSAEGVGLAVTIHKRFLNRPEWEQGMQLLERTAEWDRLPDEVLFYSSQDPFPAAVRSALAQGNGSGIQAKAFDFSGKSWRMMCHPLLDASGAAVGRLIVLLDVTAPLFKQARLLTIGGGGALLLSALFGFLFLLLRRTDQDIAAHQAALQESKEYLQATLHSVGDGVIATDLHGHVSNLNLMAETMTGWSLSEASGKPVAEVFHVVNAHTRAEVLNPVEQALSDGAKASLPDHTLLIARDGTERQVADSCAPIHDAAGNISGAVLTFRDVTEEYRQRDALRESEARYEQLAVQSGTATWEMDASGLFTFASPVFEQLTGYPAAEVTGLLHFY